MNTSGQNLCFTGELSSLPISFFYLLLALLWNNFVSFFLARSSQLIPRLYSTMCSGATSHCRDVLFFWHMSYRHPRY